ncbi:MAG: ChbG/HpnK family deacetylase [Bdellovibrio sp.]|nr:ChbG/HpnK family deacetylase [Bdellovibrio sp.]
MKDSKKLPHYLQYGTFILSGLLLAIALPLYAHKISIKTDYTDFLVYYRTALRVAAEDWQNIYTLSDGQSPFRYLPPFAGLFRPLAAFDAKTAPLFWYAVQWLAFGWGFFFLFQTLRKVTRNAFWISCISLLFILRLCLDTFTIGQVSSVMFFGFSLGLWGYLNSRSALAALGISIPMLFKIGPGIVFGTFLSRAKTEQHRALWGALFTVLGFILFGEIWGYFALGSFSAYHALWASWVGIVNADSQYYDASHYGSQSLNSVLLRFANQGFFSAEAAHHIYLGIAGVLCVGLFLFWLLRSPKSLLGRGHFYTLALFPYFWLMPETFKYSLTPLAFPVAFLVAGLLNSHARKGLQRWTWFALAFGFFTITVAGKDLVGDVVFFGIQKLSLPWLATVILGIATGWHAWSESKLSPFARLLSEALLYRNSYCLGPWRRLPDENRTLALSVLVPLPLANWGSLDPVFIQKTVRELAKKIRASIGEEEFELLIIPYGNRIAPFTHQFHPALNLLKNDLQIQTLIRFVTRERDEKVAGEKSTDSDFDGRGGALREGFLTSRGKQFLIVHLEQACEPDFFPKALRALHEGYDLVRANRRQPESSFEIPVKILPLVYKRHRLGMVFNRLVRVFLPIQTSDTHSGNFGISWRLAVNAFSTQISSHFLFDLELSLAAKALELRELDIPVKINLEAEKKFPRLLFEGLTVLRGLPILWERYRKGCYGPMPRPTKITADDWGLSRGVNFGILCLAKKGVIKRISIMANGPHLQEGLEELLGLGSQIELGLHFNLTYGKPLQTTPNPTLILENGTFIPSPFAFLRRWMKTPKQVRREFVRKEFQAQMDVLEKLGIPISYLDGHHHIHMVPGLLKELTPELKTLKNVRLPLDSSLLFSAQAPISFLAYLARPKFKSFGLSYLPFVYPGPRHFSDPGYFRAYLRKYENFEVIVHPAEKNDLAFLQYPDAYQEGRVTEFQTLQMLGVKS